MATAAGEVRAGNSILPNLTIAVATDNVDENGMEQDAEEEVLIFTNEKDAMDAEELIYAGDDTDADLFKKPLSMKPVSELDGVMAKREPQVIRPNLKFRRENERSVPYMLEKMTAEEDSFGTNFNAVADPTFDDLEEPSLIAIERIVRWGMKYNVTAFEKKKLRPQALFCVGVNELSTEDILTYFKTLGPQQIEWVDDNSCNLVWGTKDDAIRALLKISREQEAPPIKKEEVEKTITPQQFLDSTKDQNSTDIADEGAGKDKPNTENNEEQPTAAPEKSETGQDVKAKLAGGYNNVLRDCIVPLKKDGRRFHMHCRLAVMSDRKMRGAQHRSRYYQKHGNPNYNLIKGPLSSSMRSRLDNKFIQEEKLQFGLTPSLQSRLGSQQRQQSMYEDLDMLDGDDESGLLRAKAADLTDAVPVTGDEPPLPPPGALDDIDIQDNELGYGTMVADRVERLAKKSTGRRRNNSVPVSQVFTRKAGVHARLGRKMEPTGLTISVQNTGVTDSSSDSSDDELTATMKSYSLNPTISTFDANSMTTYNTVDEYPALKREYGSRRKHKSEGHRREEPVSQSRRRGRDYDNDRRDYDVSVSRERRRSKYDDAMDDESDLHRDDRDRRRRRDSRRSRSPVRSSRRDVPRDRSRSPLRSRARREEESRTRRSRYDEDALEAEEQRYGSRSRSNRKREEPKIKYERRPAPKEIEIALGGSDDSSDSSDSSSEESSSSSESSSSDSSDSSSDDSDSDESMTVTMTVASTKGGRSPRGL